MNLYRLNDDNTLAGVYPANLDGHVPKGFTDVPPITNVVAGVVQTFNGTKWITDINYRGTVYYNKLDGSKFVNRKVTKPNEELFTLVKPHVSEDPLMFVDNSWVVNEDAKKLLQLQAEKGAKKARISDIEVVLPSGGKFKVVDMTALSLAKVRLLLVDTTTVKDIVVTKQDVDYAILVLDWELKNV